MVFSLFFMGVIGASSQIGEVALFHFETKWKGFSVWTPGGIQRPSDPILSRNPSASLPPIFEFRIALKSNPQYTVTAFRLSGFPAALGNRTD